MNRTWTPKEEKRLRELYPTIADPRMLVGILNKSYVAIKTRATVLGIRRDFHVGAWPKERDARLAELYPNMRNVDIAKELGVTESAVIARGFKLQLRKTAAFLHECSKKGFYKKGDVPANKGIPQAEWMPKESREKIKATQFKKGDVPRNYKPVGSERVSKDGYTEVKVKDPNKWQLKHRVVWVENYGKIPTGKIVKFKDCNQSNLSPENLYLATRGENMMANTYHNYPKPIALAVQLRGALNRQINKRIKQLK